MFSKKNHLRMKLPKSFPQILHEILSTPECEPIIHWLPDGFSFVISDKQRFSDEILPKYFNRTLLRSFNRKLNRWGFRMVRNPCKAGELSFAHINFVRDKPYLCLKMRCKSRPRSSLKAPSAKKKAQVVAVKVDESASLVAAGGMVACSGCIPVTTSNNLSTATATSAAIGPL